MLYLACSPWFTATRLPGSPVSLEENRLTKESCYKLESCSQVRVPPFPALLSPGTISDIEHFRADFKHASVTNVAAVRIISEVLADHQGNEPLLTTTLIVSLLAGIPFDQVHNQTRKG